MRILDKKNNMVGLVMIIDTDKCAKQVRVFRHACLIAIVLKTLILQIHYELYSCTEACGIQDWFCSWSEMESQK